MDIIELILDEDSEGLTGIEAVSIVELPAIESDFVALSEQEIKLAKVDGEKRLLMGAALIPNKPLFRKNADHTFYAYSSEKTVRRASELFCLLYTSDAADDMKCVDLGGRRIIKKIFFFSSRRRHTRCRDVSWARRCV